MENLSHSIYCKGITKVYGKGKTAVNALRGIDLKLKSGELLMIVGPSGSGKTTLISILSGILDSTEGECIILGQNIKKISPEKLVRFRGKHIGFVFQTFNLIPMLTSAENVAVPLLINGINNQEALSRAKELLIRYGLEKESLRSPKDLSGGQQQRVAIARSTIHNPDLIVCDEPTSSLDHETGIKVMQILREEVLERNRSLVIVTHDSRIFRYADRIVKLEDGQLIQNHVS